MAEIREQNTLIIISSIVSALLSRIIWEISFSNIEDSILSGLHIGYFWSWAFAIVIYLAITITLAIVIFVIVNMLFRKVFK